MRYHCSSVTRPDTNAVMLEKSNVSSTFADGGIHKIDQYEYL